MTAPPIGILAGGGALPFQLAQAIKKAGGHVFIIGFKDFVDVERLKPWPHRVVRLAAAGEILTCLRASGCRDIVLIGPVRRPSLRDLRPDAEGARLLARLGRALFKGDNGLLEAIVEIFGEEGFTVRGAHEYLSDSLGKRGVLGAVAPDQRMMEDICRGVCVVRRLGDLDIGQACVVQNGLVLAVEAIEGTDAMLSRVHALKQDGAGGVLVKTLKPSQEKRVDMPTIGPHTIENVHFAGLSGIAFEAGATLMTDPEACVRRADQLKLFLYGLTESEMLTDPS